MIATKSEPNEEPVERCCFCRSRTNFWTELPDRTSGQQVAICQHCASRAKPDDIPSKKEWARRERIAHRPTIGEIARGLDNI